MISGSLWFVVLSLILFAAGAWQMGRWLHFAWRVLHEGWPLPTVAPTSPIAQGVYRTAPSANVSAEDAAHAAPEPVYFMYRNARREGDKGLAYVFEWTFSDAMEWRTEREYASNFFDVIFCQPSTVRLVRRFGKRMLRERRQGLADGIVR